MAREGSIAARRTSASVESPKFTGRHASSHRSRTVLGPLLLAIWAWHGSAPCEARQPLALFTMAQVLDYPFPEDLVSQKSGSAFAWVSNVRGVRNIWVARAPGYRAYQLTRYTGDSGQEITNLNISPDGQYLVYVRGGDHDADWPQAAQPNPSASPQEPQMQVWAVSLRGGAARALGAGDLPAVSPDGREVAFIHLPEDSVWLAPTDGGKPPQRLFFDRGRDSDLQWSPDGKSLAFVSDRGDHGFIGIFRDGQTPIEYLLPSTAKDRAPRWSPDGTRIAFVRAPGAGGPPESVLQWHPVPWSIWVAGVRRNDGRRVWQSPDTLRGSDPGGDVDLCWAAGRRLVFISDMDNWPHLYAVSEAGGKATLLTPGRFMVQDVALAPQRQYLVYSANAGTAPGDDQRRHLFRVAVDGDAPIPVTRGDHSAWSPIVMSDRALAFIDAGPRQPPRVMWGNPAETHWRFAGGNAISADFPLGDLVVPRQVAFRAPDGLKIEGELFAPASTAGRIPTSQKRLPGVIFVHGGPSRQMLLTWHPMDYYSNAYAVNQYLANHGYVVLSINYRLGVGYGHDFQYPEHWGPTGAAEYQDVLAGAEWLQRYPQVDPDRIGIWGGSWGGYLTALALARNSDVFKAGVDWHGVHDFSLVTDWFVNPTDRYQTADIAALKKAFWLSSPDSAVGTWSSPVLLVQGDDDRNVPFHQMVDLVRRLQARGVPFRELVIPDEVHAFLRHESFLRSDEATAEFFGSNLRIAPHGHLVETHP